MLSFIEQYLKFEDLIKQDLALRAKLYCHHRPYARIPVTSSDLKLVRFEVRTDRIIVYHEYEDFSKYKEGYYWIDADELHLLGTQELVDKHIQRSIDEEYKGRLEDIEAERKHSVTVQAEREKKAKKHYISMKREFGFK